MVCYLMPIIIVSIGAHIDKDQERRNSHGARKREEEEGKKRRRKRKKRREEEAQPGRSRTRSDRTHNRMPRSQARSTGRKPGQLPRTGRRPDPGPETSQFPGLRPVDRTHDRTARSQARSDRIQTGSDGNDPPNCLKLSIRVPVRPCWPCVPI